MRYSVETFQLEIANLISSGTLLNTTWWFNPVQGSVTTRFIFFLAAFFSLDRTFQVGHDCQTSSFTSAYGGRPVKSLLLFSYRSGSGAHQSYGFRSVRIGYAFSNVIWRDRFSTDYQSRSIDARNTDCGRMAQTTTFSQFNNLSRLF